MNETRTPIELLYSTAGPADVPCWNVKDSGGVPVSFDCRVAVQLPDRSEVLYELHISLKKDDHTGVPVAGERIRGRTLPGVCPMRHINGDGSFCLGWKEEPWLLPLDPEDAAEWWKRVRGYLVLQEHAKLTRRWPEERGWAHGEAAVYQSQFEKLATGLPTAVVEAARQAVFKLSGDKNTVVGRRRPCSCGSGRKVKKCHEKALVKLLELLALSDGTERSFWESWKGHSCCGTMDDCPLAKNNP